jgi:hypothetical protein
MSKTFGKLENGVLFIPMYIFRESDGLLIVNPTVKQYQDFGYKEIIFPLEIECDRETQEIVETYIENEDTIEEGD